MQKIEEVLRNLRKEYTSHTLDVRDVNPDPFVQFGQWFSEAENAGVPEPHAMSLSTVSENGFPDVRIVLLRGIEKGGFTFFTNYKSSKGRDIAFNPNVAINFFWPELERQVRIQGRAEKLSPSESDDYFFSRPRESRIGAWASSQSEVVQSREDLELSFKTYEKKFRDLDIERPPHWGGFLVKPVCFGLQP
jgi:pyridoxamine 5'-phosphate oxidase